MLELALKGGKRYYAWMTFLLAVVGIGWDEGTTSRSGARMGPRALREASTLYAFQRGAPLAAATAAACHLAPQYGHWKAHNIVEMACELPLHAADPRHAVIAVLKAPQA